MLYFAYGSNMDPVQMKARCPASRPFGIGCLEGHALCFPRLSAFRSCGVASVRPAPGQAAWGVLYELNEADLAVLDGYEGFEPGRAPHLNVYNRQAVPIIAGDLAHEALIYIAVAQENPPPPSLAYLTHMREGARHHGLPAHYTAFLDGLAHG